MKGICVCALAVCAVVSACGDHFGWALAFAIAAIIVADD